MRNGGMPMLLGASLVLHLVFLLSFAGVARKNESRQADLPVVIVEQLFSQNPEQVSRPAAGREVVRSPAGKGASGTQQAPKDVSHSPAPKSPVEQRTFAVHPEPVDSKPAARPAPPAGGREGYRAPAARYPAGEGSVPAGPLPGAAKREALPLEARGSSFVAASGAASSAAQKRGEFQETLKRLIEARKEYPAVCRRKGIEGSCRRRFILARDGSLKQVESLSHCGHPFLDEAATRAIAAVGKFPPVPAEFDGGEAAFTVAVTFSLTR